MGEPLGRPHHVGARRVERQRVLAGAEHHVAAHARRQIDHHVDVGRTDAVDDFPVKAHVPRGLARLRIAHMDMRDRRARLGRLDGSVGDLFGRDGHAGMFARRVAGPGDGAGDENFAIHSGPLT